MSGHDAPAPDARRYVLTVLGLIVAAAALGTAIYLMLGGVAPRLFGEEPPPAGTVAYQLQGGERSPVTVFLEVAATPEQRSVGLSNRDGLADRRGMVFLFPTDTDGAFWMKDTRVPLSIAFVAADGRVVAVREMTPCTADPCPTYAPGAPYRYAVELPAGSFAEAGVDNGDRVTPVDASALPKAS
jgi:uncharacterized membrane protein (UPF0127 family)